MRVLIAAAGPVTRLSRNGAGHGGINMAHEANAPVSGSERLGELDIIRGVALLGVLWMNLAAHGELALPVGHLATLPTYPADRLIGFLTSWLVAGKAQALFSLLFGFGFALLLDRIDARGGNGTRIYLRRLSILLVVGFAHLFLAWTGDILHAYAAMGFVLLLTRRWPARRLLLVGLPLACLGMAAVSLVQMLSGSEGSAAMMAVWLEGSERRFELFQGSDYPAYVRELVVSIWSEVYAFAFGWAYLGWILGRFMIGSWIYRLSWFQDSAGHAADFRRWAAVLLPLGLALALARPLLDVLGVELEGALVALDHLIRSTSQLVLALGYGAGLVVLCRSDAWKRRLAGFGAVGQMALTNYLAQSLVYMFGLYGFGLGLLPYAGGTFCMLVAFAFFALQIVFSRWWLARYRFGPAEWLWRSLTYGVRQPMRARPRAIPLPAR